MKRRNALLIAALFVLSVLTPFSMASAKEKAAAKKAAPAATAAVVDINSASQKELEALPGIGAPTAKKIIAGRPYSSAADLSKAGVSAKTIENISPLITVGAAPAAKKEAAPVEKPASKAAVKTKSAPSPEKAQETAASSSRPSGKGMVWVNKDTKIFHREGARWYGKTKNGEYMSESDAIKAGYRESKTSSKEKE